MLLIHQLKIFFKLYIFNSIVFNLYIRVTLSVHDICIFLFLQYLCNYCSKPHGNNSDKIQTKNIFFPSTSLILKHNTDKTVIQQCVVFCNIQNASSCSPLLHFPHSQQLSLLRCMSPWQQWQRNDNYQDLIISKLPTVAMMHQHDPEKQSFQVSWHSFLRKYTNIHLMNASAGIVPCLFSSVKTYIACWISQPVSSRHLQSLRNKVNF